jgi:acyl dehydratase
VHWDNDFARTVGVPAAYDFGPERVSWMGHMLTDWIGDDGFLRRLNTQIRRHNPVGDAVWCNGTVTGKSIDGDHHLVQIEVVGTNQDGALSIKGYAEVELPVA